MPNQNPFHEENAPREARGDQFSNLRTTKFVRILGPDGSILSETPVRTWESRPDQDGNYIESEGYNIQTDRAGNIVSQDGVVGISHTGLVIDTPEKIGNCTSWLHGNGSKIFLIGQDGRMTRNGGICSRCDFKLGTIYIAAVIFCFGAILGIWRGTGVF